jgi:hypothetical protein
MSLNSCLNLGGHSRILPRLQFVVEFQDPGVTIRDLESLGVLQKLHLAFDVLLAEVVFEPVLDEGGNGDLRELLGDGNEGPKRMDRGVPIGTAVEDSILVVIVYGMRLVIVNPEVACAVFRRRLRVIDARERQGD